MKKQVDVQFYFPHGVLFRNEEKDMREKLVRSDIVECVIGLGPNLSIILQWKLALLFVEPKRKMAEKVKFYS